MGAVLKGMCPKHSMKSSANDSKAIMQARRALLICYSMLAGKRSQIGIKIVDQRSFRTSAVVIKQTLL